MRTLALSMCLVMSAVVGTASGQSAPMQENQKSVMVFDIRMDMIRDSNLGKELNLAEQMGNIPAGPDAPDPSKIDRIFGAMSAPESMEAAMQMPAKMAMDFFVRVKFSDTKSVETMMNKAKEENGGVVEKNGKTFYKAPDDGQTPPGLMMHQVDANTVEMSTEAYAFRSDMAPFTDNLKTAWSKAPNEAIRIAMDLEGAKSFLAEAVDMGKQQMAGNPMMAGAGEAYLDLIDNMKDMRLSIDLSGANLLTLNATGVSDDEAQELKDGLDSLLFTAREGGKSQLEMLSAMNPEGGVIAGKILDSLVAKKDGSSVSITIPKPEGFDRVVIGAVQGMMGGMGAADDF